MRFRGSRRLSHPLDIQPGCSGPSALILCSSAVSASSVAAPQSNPAAEMRWGQFRSVAPASASGGQPFSRPRESYRLKAVRERTPDDRWKALIRKHRDQVTINITAEQRTVCLNGIDSRPPVALGPSDRFMTFAVASSTGRYLEPASAGQVQWDEASKRVRYL